MPVFIFVTNINTKKDVNRLKPYLDHNRDIINWTIDLTDEEKVLRVESNTLLGFEVSNLIRICGYDCHKMDW